MGEDCASLAVERAAAIPTEITLKVPIAAVLGQMVRTAAGTSNVVTPANLLQQV
jgi:hypothetical protein